MLLYCSHLVVRDSEPPIALLSAVAEWLSRKSGTTLSAADLVDGFSFKGRDGCAIDCAMCDVPGETCFAIQFRHPDRDFPAREWIADIGGRLDGKVWRCSVSLATFETSRYIPPVEQTTRPQVVRNIIERCQVDSATIGSAARPLTISDAEAFEYQVKDPERSFPLVVISCDRAGKFLVDPHRLASLLTGIAEVVFIPRDVDTFRLEHLLTPSFSAYGGAVTIIWHRDRPGSSRIHSSKLIPERLLEMQSANLELESELLAKICHRSNAGNARTAVTLDSVRRMAAQARLRFALSKGEPDKDLLALYEDADKQQRAQIESQKRDIDGLLDELARSEEERERLEQHVDALNQAIAAGRLAERATEERVSGIPAAQVLELLCEKLSLEKCLHVIGLAFPDRLVILESARRSAEESADFNNPQKALELMWKLCDGYWSAIVSGSDQDARAVFGNSYAANESETARNNKRARELRTFEYRGKPVEMMKHLKIGVKDSTAETWRLHFHWDAEEKKIVIGHCGKHLDHG
jgi:hypothetical protein